MCRPRIAERAHGDCKVVFLNRQGRQERQENRGKPLFLQDSPLGALGVLGGFIRFYDFAILLRNGAGELQSPFSNENLSQNRQEKINTEAQRAQETLKTTLFLSALCASVFQVFPEEHFRWSKCDFAVLLRNGGSFLFLGHFAFRMDWFSRQLFPIELVTLSRCPIPVGKWDPM